MLCRKCGKLVKANELKSRIKRSVIQIKERIHDLESGNSQPNSKPQPKLQPRPKSQKISVPSRPRPPVGHITNINHTMNRTVNKTINKTVVNNSKPSGLISNIPGIDSKMVERILAEKLEPTNAQKME